jgi:hypothetical protein
MQKVYKSSRCLDFFVFLLFNVNMKKKKVCIYFRFQIYFVDTKFFLYDELLGIQI